MSQATVVREAWTLDDLLALPEDGQRYEIVDGSLHMTPPAGGQHNRAAGRLHVMLDDALPAGLEPQEGTGIQLQGSVLIPDLVVVRSSAVDAGRLLMPPADVLLAVEVVSRSSVTMDRVTKLAMYAQARIPAYWRVEPTEPAVYVYFLDGDRYAEPLVARADEPLALDHPAPLRLCAAGLIR